MTIIVINAGELFVGGQKHVLESPGLGSCIAVCLYDAKKKNGGMAHIMLPASNLSCENASSTSMIVKKENGEDQSYRYADIAIEELVRRLKVLGSFSVDLEAKIFGGSAMFAALINSRIGMGQRNIEAVRNKLRDLAIPIVAEDVGGNIGRSVRFFLENGEVEIRKRM
jgi:chemotaxis protein CheD